MDLEEAQSLVANIGLLHDAVEEAEEKALTAMEAVTEKLDSDKAKLYKQTSQTVETLSKFVAERFLAKYTNSVFVWYDDLYHLDPAGRVTVNYKGRPNFEVVVNMLRLVPRIPGDPYRVYGDRRHAPDQMSWTLLSSLDGVWVPDYQMGEASVLDDPDGALWGTAIMPEHCDTNKPCRLRESVTTLQKRIAKFSEQIAKEENPACSRYMEKVLQKMISKREFMEETNTPQWLGCYTKTLFSRKNQ